MNRQMNNIITDIVPQVNSPSRFSVFIDGEFSFGISDFDLYNLRLSKGDEITEEKMAEIESIIDIDKCKNYAIDLVSRKMYKSLSSFKRNVKTVSGYSIPAPFLVL